MYFYALEQLESDLSLSLESYCYGVSCEIYGPREINENHTIEDIAKYLKEDMGFDYEHWLNLNLPKDFWMKLYNDWGSFWKKSEEDGLRSLGKAFAPLLGKKQEETEEMFLKPQQDAKTPKKMALFRKICDVSYLLTSIFFILSILAIAIGFLII